MPATTTRKQGKTLFVKETLIDNPQATTAVVNEAWAAAGMAGTISETLVTKMRSQMGLSGNLRGKSDKESGSTTASLTRAGAKRRHQERQAASPSGAGHVEDVRGRIGTRAELLADVEADLDRLLFRVMSLGNLPSVANAIRETRRALYRACATKQ